MPRSGMEAPEDDIYGTEAEWRRSLAQPVTLLTSSTNPSPHPDKLKPAYSHDVGLLSPSTPVSGLYGGCDVQGVISGAVVPAKPVPGGCTEEPAAMELVVTQMFSYIIQYEKRHHSRPSAGGGVAFQWWVGAVEVSSGSGF